jgi:hypothetical protein
MNPTGTRKLIVTAVLALLVLTMSTEVLAQGRNRRVNGNFNKKCAKFVNCHDARDGRWDGRGPGRNSRLTSRIFRRNRRDRDDNWNGRRGRRDRDFDRNRRWRRNR